MNSNLDLQKIADDLDFDLEDVEMLIDVFIESATESLLNIKDAIKDGNFDVLFQEAHAIKGSAANLTLLEISDIARDIELKARAKEDIDYSIMYSDLSKLIESIQ